MTTWKVLARASSTLLLLGCQTGAFPCQTDAQCGASGLCVGPGYCGFPDDDCESGLRYGSHAGGGRAGQCVAAGDDTVTGSTTAPSTTSTSATSTTTTTTTTITTDGTTSSATEDTTIVESDIPADDTTPPALIAVEALSQTSILLTFSEPLDPMAAVDPSRFRLSLTRYDEAGYTAYYLAGNGPRPYGAGFVQSVTADAPDRLVLELYAEVSAGRCDDLLYSYSVESPLNVHYAASLPIPDPVRDLAGNELEAIAEHWVMSAGGTVYIDGYFPELDPLLAIPCPG